MALNRRSLYLQEAADFCGLDVEMLEEILSFGLLGSETAMEDEFLQPQDFILLRRIRRLREHLGINLEGIEVIIRMREQIENMQQEISGLRRSLSFYKDPQEFRES
jgi:hypothetical protein